MPNNSGAIPFASRGGKVPLEDGFLRTGSSAHSNVAPVVRGENGGGHLRFGVGVSVIIPRMGAVGVSNKRLAIRMD